MTTPVETFGFSCKRDDSRISNMRVSLHPFKINSVIMKKIAVTIALAAIVAAGYSQQVVTLQQCREQALQNNRNVKQSELDKRIAVAHQKEARASYLPQIDGSGSIMNLPDMKNISVPGFFLPTANSATEAANHQYSGESNVYFPGIDLGTKNLTIYQTQIVAKQALFAGGQVRNANKMANEAVAIADQATALTASEVVMNTDQAFWQLVSIQEQVKVAERYVTMLDSLESQLVTAYQLGLIPKSEQLKVAVQRNEASINLLKARNGLQLARMNLCRQIGVDLSTNLAVTVDNLGEPQLPAAGLDVDKALDARSETKILEGQVAIADYQRKNAMAEFMPTLGVQVSYGYNYVPNLYNGGWNTIASAQLSVPIVHWGEKRQKLKAARYKLEQSKLKQDDAREFMRLEIQQRWLQFDEAYQTIGLAAKSKAEAEESLSEVQASFNAGLNTTTDLLNAQASWQKAHASYVEAVSSYQIAKSVYLKGIGELTVSE